MLNLLFSVNELLRFSRGMPKYLRIDEVKVRAYFSVAEINPFVNFYFFCSISTHKLTFTLFSDEAYDSWNILNDAFIWNLKSGILSNFLLRIGVFGLSNFLVKIDNSEIGGDVNDICLDVATCIVIELQRVYRLCR